MKSTIEIIKTEKIMRYAIIAFNKDFEKRFTLITCNKPHKNPYELFQFRKNSWKKWVKEWIDEPYIKSKNYWDGIKK